MITTTRVPLVGRLHSLRLTASDVAFMLRVEHHGRGVNDFRCYSSCPAIINAAADLVPGQLIGIIGVAPQQATKPSGLHVERLALLGRKVREVA
jgi:hypothetical protein